MDKIKPKKKMAMGKMMGGGMSKKPMAYKKGGVVSESKKKQFRKNKEGQKDFNKKIIGRGKKFIKDTMEGKFADPKRGTAEPRIGKMGGGMLKKPMMMKGGVAEAARKIKNKK